MYKELLKELKRIGLNKEAKVISDVYKLVRFAQGKFQKEVEVFASISQILKDLEQIKMFDIYQGRLVLPGYGLKIGNQQIIKDQEPLTNLPKSEILKGLDNYLKNFVKFYMEKRVSRLYYHDADFYARVITAVQEVLPELEKVERVVRKGPPKQSIMPALNKVLKHQIDIALYLSVVKKEALKVRDASWQQTEGVIDEDLPGIEKYIDQKRGRIPADWGMLFGKLHFDVNQEMREVEQEFLKEYELSETELYQMIRSFRTYVEQIPELRKTAEKDDDEFILEEVENKKQDKDKEQSDNEFLPLTFKLDPDVEKELESLFGEKGKKKEEKEKKKKKLGPDTAIEEFLRGPMLLPPPERESFEFAKTVKHVKDSANIIQDQEKGIPYPPMHLFLAFEDYLIPEFRRKYHSLLVSTLQVYRSAYQIEATQKKLGAFFEAVAQKLEAQNVN